MTFSSTPPHHPTFGISVDHEVVREIVAHCLRETPDKITIEDLASGGSYNNRIYFVHALKGETTTSYVLKVNGRFFGPDKVENEVGCLELLRQYCPTTPVPRVIAWSLKGNDVFTIERPSRSSVITLAQDKSIPSWILMTKVPGESLQPSSLSEIERTEVAVQLADIVSSWRISIPSSNTAGNMGLYRGIGDKQPVSSQASPRTAVTGGNLNFGRPRGSLAMASLQAYYQAEIRHQIAVLQSNAAFAATRAELSRLLTDFMDDTLLKLSIFRQDHQAECFVFTCNDLAPRNVLVSGQPPAITGLVDFEFSGFFPAMEEFEQEWADDDEEDKNWPTDMYETLLEMLAESGATTPSSIRDQRCWKEYRCLYKLRNCIAPWWLVQGTDAVVDLTANTDVIKASDDVKDVLSELKDLIGDRSRV